MKNKVSNRAFVENPNAVIVRSATTGVGAKNFVPLLSQTFIVRDCFAALAMTAWGAGNDGIDWTSSCVSSLSTFNFQFSTNKVDWTLCASQFETKY
jgi:hypothetical protein